MTSKEWIKTWFAILLVIPFIGGVNYLVDPYGLFNHDILGFEKRKQADKIRLVKALKLKSIEPKSIILGSSRAGYGFDPNHQYFPKPSYNLSIPSGSMYESRLYFEAALKRGQLKKVLLVVDYRMFVDPQMKEVAELESYFSPDYSPMKTNFSLTVFGDSLKTVFRPKSHVVFLENGQRGHNFNWSRIQKSGGHLAVMNSYEKIYYKGYDTAYVYQDSRKDSFEDFNKLVAACHQNGIKLDVIFGPSHIRQWEALDYYLDYNKWLAWKKDIVLALKKIAQHYKTSPYRLTDFSIYHKFTAEKVPKNKNIKMKYYWESSHYNNELGKIVLDRLLDGQKKYPNFGVVVTAETINNHNKQQLKNRHQYIDVHAYKMNIKQLLQK